MLSTVHLEPLTEVEPSKKALCSMPRKLETHGHQLHVSSDHEKPSAGLGSMALRAWDKVGRWGSVVVSRKHMHLRVDVECGLTGHPVAAESPALQFAVCFLTM